MNEVQDYPVVRRQSVAKFFYKGQSHSHPVRRTVLLIENRPEHFVGYEIREGSSLRTLEQAPIKTYSKNRIASLRQVDQRRKIVASALRKGQDLNSSTLWRGDLLDIAKVGV